MKAGHFSCKLIVNHPFHLMQDHHRNILFLGLKIPSNCGQLSATLARIRSFTYAAMTTDFEGYRIVKFVEKLTASVVFGIQLDFRFYFRPFYFSPDWAGHSSSAQRQVALARVSSPLPSKVSKLTILAKASSELDQQRILFFLHWTRSVCSCKRIYAHHLLCL